MAPRVKKDVEVHGVKMRAGERVLLSYGAACRDPTLWNDPDKVDIDRGAGVHAASVNPWHGWCCVSATKNF